jgi:crotonobetainyl-CoA:carnitine CoA-transferase CaiB-like acyl-CoA transferase
VYADPDLRERGIFVTVDDPGKGGAVTIPAYPVRLSRSPARVAAPPQPGQHTAEVLREWLGEGADLTAADGAAGEDAERRRATPEARP